MISRETENVTSIQEVENAFKALSEEGKPYLTKQEIYQVCYINIKMCPYFCL